MIRKAMFLGILLALPMLLGCSANHERAAKELASPPVDPQRVPKDITLYQPAPVLATRFEVTESGYALQESWITTGAPTSQIDQNRAVAIRALDAQGRPVETISVHNPRDVHTTGASNPDSKVLERATLTVFFSKPDAIEALEVEVRAGANEGYKQAFKVEPRQRPTGNKG